MIPRSEVHQMVPKNALCSAGRAGTNSARRRRDADLYSTKTSCPICCWEGHTASTVRHRRTRDVQFGQGHPLQFSRIYTSKAGPEVYASSPINQQSSANGTPKELQGRSGRLPPLFVRRTGRRGTRVPLNHAILEDQGACGNTE